MDKTKMLRIADEMLKSNPRIMEFGLDNFKHAVKVQQGIKITNEEAKEIAKIIWKLPKQKTDIRYLAQNRGVKL